MLKKYCFRNYEDFKEIFGYRKTNDGKMVRKNKILLSLYKNGNDKPLREILNEAEKDSYEENLLNRLFNITSINELDMWFKRVLRVGFDESDSGHVWYNKIMDGKYTFRTNGNEWYCDNDGICNDPSTRDKIRFISIDNDGRRREMYCSPARLLNKIMSNYKILSLLPLQIKRHFEELFAEDWKAFNKSFEDIKLVVNNDDFNKIYNSYYLSGGDCCNGIFNSCMVDKGFEDFYHTLPDCQCAYLVRKDKIIARCIIFKAYDYYNDKAYRLAERQYSADSDDSLKRLLVDKLIEGGYIDGYKKIGAGCADISSFILNDETSLEGAYLFIKTDDYDMENDYFPYMDSFCFLDPDSHRAYNSDDMGHSFVLRETDGGVDRCGTWSDYHGRYLNNNTEDFSYVDYLNDYILDECLVTDSNGDSILMEDAVECPHCGEYFRISNGYYSSLTDEEYCCLYCKDESEEQWEEEYNEVEAEMY